MIKGSLLTDASKIRRVARRQQSSPVGRRQKSRSMSQGSKFWYAWKVLVQMHVCAK